MIKEYMNTEKLNVDDNKFEREFSMDEAEYQHIMELAESGHFIDFQIPKDAPIGKRHSDIAATKKDSISSDDDQIPVDLEHEFGGGLSG